MIKSSIFMGLFLFLVGCWPSPRVGTKPVMQVNNHQLTAKDFASSMARKLKNFDAITAKDPDNVRRAKEEILRAYIVECLVTDYAANVGLEITGAELEKEVNLFRSSYPDDLSFRRSLAEENMSFVEWRESLRKNLLERKVFKKITEKIPPPTSDELARVYADKKELFKRKERIYLRQIVTDDLAKAETIKTELRKRDFAEVAKKVSVSPEGKSGGLVGWVEKGTVDIFDKAFNLTIGGVSQVLESVYGFHIFKVERRTPPGYASFEEVKAILEQEVRGKKEQAAFASWLDQQIRQSRVLRDNALVDAITVETRGDK